MGRISLKLQKSKRVAVEPPWDDEGIERRRVKLDHSREQKACTGPSLALELANEPGAMYGKTDWPNTSEREPRNVKKDLATRLLVAGMLQRVV